MYVYYLLQWIQEDHRQPDQGHVPHQDFEEANHSIISPATPPSKQLAKEKGIQEVEVVCNLKV